MIKLRYFFAAVGISALAVIGMAEAQNPPAPSPAPSAGSTAVVGTVAAGVADDGTAPVKQGCVSNTAPPTVVVGQISEVSCDVRGAPYAVIKAPAGSTTAAVIAPVVAGQASQAGLFVNGQNLFFNGATWEDAITCNNIAVVNVTAAATTEIVPLTAGQSIRVCSFSVSMSLAGSAQFVNGTGSNCGTGTANLTGAIPLSTATPWSLSAGNANIFRAPVANALCLAAVTGNVTGFVSFAKF